MSSGIFFLSSEKDSKLSNGSIIRYQNKLYLIGCAHSFFEKNNYSINFLVNPSIKGSQINSTLNFQNLSVPNFHPDDSDNYTNEISLFELDSNQESELNHKNIPIYRLDPHFRKPSKNAEYIFKGYNAGIATDINFQGVIEEKEFSLQYLNYAPLIDSDYNNLIKQTMNNHILKLTKGVRLGAGYSGSSILSKDMKTLKGIYFASTVQLKNQLKTDSQYGCAIFAGADKIIETINGKV